MGTRTDPAADPSDSRSHVTTLEAARHLGMAVRSVQLMVDRGDLHAWKTPGGHRRISRESLERAIAARGQPGDAPSRPETAPAGSTPVPAAPDARKVQVLLIEDSVHYQTLISMLLRQRFPQIELHVADDGLAGLAMYGQIRPDVLIVDILLPGIDGATLIMSLRSHEQFAGSTLIVVTSLDRAEREPYAFALTGVPVVHKSRLVSDLPALLERCLAGHDAASAPAAP